VLEVKFQDKNIDDILNMTIDQAIEFFSNHKQKKIISKLQSLQDVGLGYVTMGQSSSTLSGGEAQRIKLASFLIKGSTTTKTLFILMNLPQDFISTILKNFLNHSMLYWITDIPLLLLNTIWIL